MDLEKLFSWTITAVVALCLLGGTFYLVNVARTDGRVDYCRVLYYNENNVQLPVYIVEGHRPWRTDIRMAITTSADEAEAKRKLLCPQ